MVQQERISVKQVVMFVQRHFGRDELQVVFCFTVTCSRRYYEISIRSRMFDIFQCHFVMRTRPEMEERHVGGLLY